MRAVAVYIAATLAFLWLADFLRGEGADPPWLMLAKAGAVVLVYIAFLVIVLRRRAPDEKQNPEAPIIVAYASQTGVAEELARRTASALKAGGRSARIADMSKLSVADLEACEIALFVASTTGEGDPPDNAVRFAGQVMRDPAALNSLRYAVLALGDRSYDDYCGFGRRLDAWLRESGAGALFDRVDIDRGDERAIKQWFERIAGLGGVIEGAGAEFQTWRLVERRQLNPGSDNPPLFHIGLAPAGPAPKWRAGDIAVISPRNDPAEVDRFLVSFQLEPSIPVTWRGETMSLRDALLHLSLPRQGEKNVSPQQLVDALSPLPLREYSLASLPADGAAELVVRQMKGEGGKLGVGSGWLTAHARQGGDIEMRLRENRAFHGPDDERPMILIGAGSGIAGLRAHIKERRAAGRKDNWLMFGERDPEKDYLYRHEIEAWVAEAAITRLDLGFMDENGVQRFIQDILREAAGDLRAWIDRGAAIYVCGSRAGLGDWVDRALRDLLGDERVDALTADGNYRRDVY